MPVEVRHDEFTDDNHSEPACKGGGAFVGNDAAAITCSQQRPSANRGDARQRVACRFSFNERAERRVRPFERALPGGRRAIEDSPAALAHIS